MRDSEHQLKRRRLQAARGGQHSFLCFADTVAGAHFQGTNECHWLVGARKVPAIRRLRTAAIIIMFELGHCGEKGLQQ